MNDQIADLRIGFRRFDAMMEYVNDILAEQPETFPVIVGTKISLCRMNDFVGESFSDIPRLAIYFHYDEDMVRIISVEKNNQESYGC